MLMGPKEEEEEEDNVNESSMEMNVLKNFNLNKQYKTTSFE
jgi:hypothetical protein